MAKETVQYKRTVKGSVGAGMGALFNASGRQFFILEHKSSSKYNRAGTSQKIIIDQIELGRDSNCQVRYDDETWPIVSRRHAAIVKDAQGWKIVPLSQTNSTYVNGMKVESAWFLQNGDEIQLATNGPKLGFIMPSGKQSLVSSIRLTERLNLFRQQALRPYKTAIGVMASLLLVLAIGSGFMMHHLKEEIIQLNGQNVSMEKLLAKAESDRLNQEKKDSLKLDSLNKETAEFQAEYERIQRELYNIKNLSNRIETAKQGVYAVFTTVKIYLENNVLFEDGTLGTGFLLDDGRFVTARHCVEPWLYSFGPLAHWVALSKANTSGFRVEVNILAKSMGDSFTIPYEDFKMDRNANILKNLTSEIEIAEGETIELNLESARPVQLQNGQTLGDETMWGSDWAYVQISDKKGVLKSGAAISDKLKAGTEVHVLGYPAGLGVSDGKNRYEPIYNKMTVSREGLNNAKCIMVSEGTAHGNSGGPVFVYRNGTLSVIGIVSRLEAATQQLGSYGIVQQQQQYDHLVPMCNLN